MAEEVGPLIGGEGYLYIDLSTVGEQITAYIASIEKERTNKICKCEWIVHPDDTDKPEGERRMRRGEATLDCPVHTKEGFIIGFIRHMMEHGKPAIDIAASLTSQVAIQEFSKEVSKRSNIPMSARSAGSYVDIDVTEFPDGD